MRNFRSEAEAESVRPSTSRKRSLKFFLLDWPFPAKQFPVSKWPPPPSDSSGPFGGNVRPNKMEDGRQKVPTAFSFSRFVFFQFLQYPFYSMYQTH